jgi:hypothetical protein
MTTPATPIKTASERALLPCPFCGSSDLSPATNGKLYVSCNACGCFGPGPQLTLGNSMTQWTVREAETIGMWQARASIAAAQAEQPVGGALTVRDYLTKKYRGWPTTMLGTEARVFGIPYPLQAGWLERHGDTEITPAMAEALRSRLEQRRGASAANGIAALTPEPAALHQDCKERCMRPDGNICGGDCREAPGLDAVIRAAVWDSAEVVHPGKLEPAALPAEEVVSERLTVEQATASETIRVKFDDNFLVEWSDSIPDGEYTLVRSGASAQPAPEPAAPVSFERHPCASCGLPTIMLVCSNCDAGSLPAADAGEVERDAARYRYLRDVAWNEGSLVFYSERYGPEDWDAHIDAAIESIDRRAGS